MNCCAYEINFIHNMEMCKLLDARNGEKNPDRALIYLEYDTHALDVFLKSFLTSKTLHIFMSHHINSFD